MTIYIFTSKTLKTFLKPLFRCTIPFDLCGQVENFKWILWSQKTGVKCGHLRFLIYKGIFNSARCNFIYTLHKMSFLLQKLLKDEK